MPSTTGRGISPAAVSTPAVAANPAGAALLLGALGVVFGDIGTSPIYAFRETLRAAGAEDDGASASGTVFGVLSLIFWAVTLVVAVKYVVLCACGAQRLAEGVDRAGADVAENHP